MRIFKKLDFWLQVSILIAAIVFCFFNPIGGICFYFFGYFLWDIISVIVHLFTFKVSIRSIQKRRLAILFHILIIIGAPLLIIFVIPYLQLTTFIFYGYLVYAFCMPLYYLWMSHRELQVLDEIHDQVSLIDVGQH